MKRVVLITTLVLGTLLVLAPAANAVVMSADSGGGAGGGLVFHTDVLGGKANLAPSPSTATQAQLLRSEGLATHYGVSPATQAVMLRSTGLGDYYGSRGVTFRPDILGGNGGEPAGTTATGGNSFNWGTVGIGAATLVGVMLLGLASLAVTRRRRELSF